VNSNQACSSPESRSLKTRLERVSGNSFIDHPPHGDRQGAGATISNEIEMPTP
jgi:hypothetical protein